MSTVDRHPAPCQVCRRPTAMCICTSHAKLRAPELQPDDLVRPPARERLPASQVEARVQEALHLYYGRDAAGLTRLVRGWFA